MYISWDIVDYSESDRRGRTKFPPQHLGSVSVPATVVDCEGRILIWYLPGIFSTAEQVGPRNLAVAEYALMIAIASLVSGHQTHIASNEPQR